MDDTKAALTLIRQAIGDYYSVNGAYPRPAPLDKGPSDASFGLAVAADPPINNCANGICRSLGATSYIDPSPSPGASYPLPQRDVLSGGVPFKELKLPLNVALDGWNRKILYAVTKSQTVKATFSSLTGAIVTKDWKPADFKTGTITVEDEVGAGNTHIALVSFGPDGAGAYTIDGTLYKPCVSTNGDGINCGYKTHPFFLDMGYVDTHGDKSGGGSKSGAWHYDDITMSMTDVPTDIWQVAATSSANIRSNTRVGIGTNDVSTMLTPDGAINYDSHGNEQPDYSIVLDVAGNINATGNMSAPMLCDLSGDNCFSPNDLDGSGQIACAPGGSNVMVGLANRLANCNATMPAAIAGATCNPGKYVTGFSGGVIQCGP